MLLSAEGHDALDNLQQKTKEALAERGASEAIVVRSPSLNRKKTDDDAHNVSARYLKSLSNSRLVREGPVGQRERVKACQSAMNSTKGGRRGKSPQMAMRASSPAHVVP